jgi:co-chaperonin GroES (HSP10)
MKNATEDGPFTSLSEWIAEEEKKCFLTPVLIDGGRIVIKQDNFHYSGRIAIPDTAKRRPTTGHVVRVDDVEKFGDLLGKRVVFGMYSGTLIVFKDKTPYRVLDTREILAVVEIEDVELDNVE